MFLPCVLVPGAHETRGGAHLLIFFCQIRGAERLLPNVSAKHRGQMGVKYVVPCFFGSGEVFGLFPVAAGHARMKKQKKEKKKKKKRSRKKKKKNKKKRNKRRRNRRRRRNTRTRRKKNKKQKLSEEEPEGKEK